MSATRALVRKELQEIFGDPYSRRGGFLQAGIFILVLGVLTPPAAAHAWLYGGPLAIVYYAFLPGMTAAAIAADAFAGERERRTLETLLTTPLTESQILFGKALAAILWALSVATVAFLVGIVMLNVQGIANGALFLPAPRLVLGAFGATLASASFMSSIAIVVSMLIPAARPAQQVASLGSSAIFGGAIALWKASHLAVEWTNVFVVEAAIVLAALVVLEIARALFRRERFFRSA